MASIQRTEYIDVLSVRKIFAKGDNNATLAANSILATDGNGGTQWVDMSTIQGGVTFNTFITTQSTFTSGPYSSQFSILDGDNAGLIPTTGTNEVKMYAKAFGKIDVDGQDSIYSFDTYTGTINSNVKIVGSGIINISTDTTQNKIQFYSPNDATSSLSTVVGNFTGLNRHLTNTFSSFSSPFSTFIYDSISSFSTAQGPVVVWPDLRSTISSFSTAFGPVVDFPQMNSTFSTFSTSIGPIVQFPQMYQAFSTFSTDIGPVVIFPQMNSAFSSFSTVLGQTVQLQGLNTALSSFSTVLGPTIQALDLDTALSSFSTALGPTVKVPQMLSTFSTFSTAMGPVIQLPSVISTFAALSTVYLPELYSTISSFSTSMGPFVTTSTFLSSLSTNNSLTLFNIGTLNTSTINMSGIRQPFIQYGTGQIDLDGSNVVTLPRNYSNFFYNVQLTYYGRNSATIPLNSLNQTKSNFVVYGDFNTSFYWTTYGNLF
jgi:hypothetical protein